MMQTSKQANKKQKCNTKNAANKKCCNNKKMQKIKITASTNNMVQKKTKCCSIDVCECVVGARKIT